MLVNELKIASFVVINLFHLKSRRGGTLISFLTDVSQCSVMHIFKQVVQWLLYVHEADLCRN